MTTSDDPARAEAAAACGLDEYDYCPESQTGRHWPEIARWQDPEMPAGYVTVECDNCHQTTGVAFTMPESALIDWG